MDGILALGIIVELIVFLNLNDETKLKNPYYHYDELKFINIFITFLYYNFKIIYKKIFIL